MSTESIIKDPGPSQHLVHMAVKRLEKELLTGSEALQDDTKVGFRKEFGTESELLMVKN